jgi:hypothetical protein
MRSLAVRLTLLGVFVIAIGVAAYFVWKGEARMRDDERAARAFDSAALTAEREALNLRADQQAYVAAGQGDQFWTSKVTTGITSLREKLSTLRAQTTSASAQSALDNASSALEDFAGMDARVREQVQNGQKLTAADLIFAEGLDTTRGLAASLDRARTAELQERAATAARTHREQLVAVAGAAGASLLVVILLVPRPAAEVTPVRDEAFAATRDSADSSSGLDLDDAIDREWASHARKTPPPDAAPALPAIDLPGIAAVCTDLARVVDTRALPAILERAAAVLDAPGIVLWIADPDGRELSPIVTHGYPQQIVSRLGSIVRNAENATASAFRTSLLQTVKADAVSNGAIAAPLVTPAGCVGVMAAEVRHAGETDPAKLAAATIVAAQLATLVGPPSSRAQAKAEAAGA